MEVGTGTERSWYWCCERRRIGLLIIFLEEPDIVVEKILDGLEDVGFLDVLETMTKVFENFKLGCPRSINR